MCDSEAHACARALALGGTRTRAPSACDRLLAGFHVCEAQAVYRPRHPERSAFYKLLDQHFERYLSAYEERYERSSGPLRPVVQKTVHAYTDCGRLENGFARIVCPACKGEHLLAFSCQTRNFCPSCQAKRAALFAERLQQEILAPVPHRHVVFTIPRTLRGLMQRERRLLSVLSHCAFRALRTVYAAMAESSSGRLGMVASLQTFGARVTSPYAANAFWHSLSDLLLAPLVASPCVGHPTSTPS